MRDATVTFHIIYTLTDLSLEHRYGLQLLLLLEDLLLHLINLFLLGSQGLFSSSQPLLKLVRQLLLHHLRLKETMAKVKGLGLYPHNLKVLIWLSGT